MQTQFWFLLRSDAHHDNPDCDQDMELRHLKMAKDRGAGIIDIGDLFCAMQGKYDPRASKRKLRPEHQRDDYLDALVETAADFYEPFARNIILLGRGNHETSISKRHETDLTERLIAVLNARTGARIMSNGYTGWVRFCFRRQHQRSSRVMWYTHGYGGGGPVTLDTIQRQRQQAYIENADIMLSGHTHDAWHIDAVKHHLSKSGIVERRQVHQLKIPTYKDEYRSGEGGWHVETGKPPKPLGAWWLRFFYESIRQNVVSVKMEITRAD